MIAGGRPFWLFEDDLVVVWTLQLQAVHTNDCSGSWGGNGPRWLAGFLMSN